MTAQTLAGPLAPRAFARVRRLPGAAAIAAAALVVILIMALFGSLLAPRSPNLVEITNPFAGSSSAHLLGTDSVGRDILSRVIVGSRTAVLGPLIVVSFSTAIGVALAVLGAWFGGWLDIGVSRLNDLLLAFPGMLLAIIAASVFGAGLLTAAVALSISYIPYTARIVRSEALRQRRLPYIEAAWLQGVPTAWIWLRHLIPSLWSLIIAQTVLSFAYATIDVAAISYLGLGVQPPTADWGTMVASGQEGVLQGHPMEAFAAGGCLVIMILSLGIVGDHLAAKADRGR
jgi:peptide/nickel transport system permease protein